MTSRWTGCSGRARSRWTCRAGWAYRAFDMPDVLPFAVVIGHPKITGHEPGIARHARGMARDEFLEARIGAQEVDARAGRAGGASWAGRAR